jgi:hypothetical protein
MARFGAGIECSPRRPGKGYFAATAGNVRFRRTVRAAAAALRPEKRLTM